MSIDVDVADRTAPLTSIAEFEARLVKAGLASAPPTPEQLAETLRRDRERLDRVQIRQQPRRSTYANRSRPMRMR